MSGLGQKAEIVKTLYAVVKVWTLFKGSESDTLVSAY